MICIVDYGLGNSGSLVNMCHKIGYNAILSNDEDTIRAATHLILPGVGAFDSGMKNLEEKGLVKPLSDAVLDRKTPILGICLGAQLMFDGSEEGVLPGLGWIKGRVKRFSGSRELKVPHMGWNSLVQIDQEQLFVNMPDYPLRFYFVHSYFFEPANREDISAYCHYGFTFSAAFERKNIKGVQFHPEKSHKFGTQLLTNFFSNQ
jgi:glutamine amidotransferase